VLARFVMSWIAIAVIAAIVVYLVWAYVHAALRS
jgi:hypothetical protein